MRSLKNFYLCMGLSSAFRSFHLLDPELGLGVFYSGLTWTFRAAVVNIGVQLMTAYTVQNIYIGLLAILLIFSCICSGDRCGTVESIQSLLIFTFAAIPSMMIMSKIDLSFCNIVLNGLHINLAYLSFGIFAYTIIVSTAFMKSRFSEKYKLRSENYDNIIFIDFVFTLLVAFATLLTYLTSYSLILKILYSLTRIMGSVTALTVFPLSPYPVWTQHFKKKLKEAKYIANGFKLHFFIQCSMILCSLISLFGEYITFGYIYSHLFQSAVFYIGFTLILLTFIDIIFCDYLNKNIYEILLRDKSYDGRIFVGNFKILQRLYYKLIGDKMEQVLEK